jgi:hypothetical protein
MSPQTRRRCCRPGSRLVPLRGPLGSRKGKRPAGAQRSVESAHRQRGERGGRDDRVLSESKKIAWPHPASCLTHSHVQLKAEASSDKVVSRLSTDMSVLQCFSKLVSANLMLASARSDV